eukprot:CAMPEP_0201476630 /NCGR_PEP_ID=MMETSP0151_2-20130828/1797_1 /ASSEMBLY_ACC=CAM_ASM_000257 /TAXON_ID=200890 /ORGANISM="Paramoeba atlantica, Strain 621/1 / CCAP 1560/9" /LENGTH=279 /DNA_ID=CAMNT_0047857049 /DNA_START=58 /DNA_END=897 /DNA_ORIENTATION=-
MADNEGVWGWFSSIKEASNKIYEVYKEDLGEFTNTIASDTKEAYDTIEKEATTKTSTIFSFISSSLKNENEISEKSGNGNGNWSSENFEADSETYVSPPQEKQFEEWLKANWDDEEAKETSKTILESNPIVKDLYSQLVPSHVSDDLFWKRYFYRAHLSRLQWEERAKKVNEVVGKSQDQENENEKDLSWGDDEEEEVEEEEEEREREGEDFLYGNEIEAESENENESDGDDCDIGVDDWDVSDSEKDPKKKEDGAEEREDEGKGEDEDEDDGNWGDWE